MCQFHILMKLLLLFHLILDKTFVIFKQAKSIFVDCQNHQRQLRSD